MSKQVNSKSKGASKSKSKAQQASAPSAPKAQASAPSAPTVARPVVVRDVFNNSVNRGRSHIINDALLSFGANGATVRQLETKAQEIATERGAIGRDGAPLIIRAVRNHLLFLLARDRCVVANDATGAQVWRASDAILQQVGASAPSKSKSKRSKSSK